MSLRITDSYMANSMIKHVNRSLADMLRYQEIAGGMRRVNSYADDPRAVGAIHRYRALLETNAQYLSNTDRARAIVEVTDSAIMDINDLLAEVRALALQEASATGTHETHANAAEAIQQMIERALNILNQTVEGDYIFGGHRTGTMPFVRSGDQVIYQGDDGEIPAKVGPNTTVIVNIPGSRFMGTNSAVLGGTEDMAPRLAGTDLLADLNLGGGWTPGQIQIVDGDNTTYTVDLAGAVTVDDVIAAIDAAGGGALTAGISADGTGLELNGTGPHFVGEIGEGTTAQTLGLLGSSDGDLLVGRDVRTAPGLGTALADVPGLAGALPLGEIVVTIGDVDTTVDFGGAVTIGDLNAALGAALPTMQLQIDGAALRIVNGTTETFFISNATGSTTASDLGIEGTGSPRRIFGVLEDLRQALLSDDTAAIRASVSEIMAVEDVFLAQLINVGGKENSLDWTESMLRQRDVRLQSNLSREWDADMAEVATGLSRAEVAYQASLLVTSRLFETNLMQYLR
jgi:flagellin-like hook-associated protein FlgL